MNKTITDINGILVGNYEDMDNYTGCTVVFFEKPLHVFSKVFGGWPGTYDTESTAAGMTFSKKRSIFISGGDIFGLACAFGIMRFITEKENKVPKGPNSLPFVVGADIYDLDIASVENVDYSLLGYKACLKLSDKPVDQGNFGAGIGATVGKMKGIEFAFKGGIGSSIEIERQLKVASLVAVNSLGNIYDPTTCRAIAGARIRKDGIEIEDFWSAVSHYIANGAKAGNTTVCIIATNVDIGHENFERVCNVVYASLGSVIRPMGLSHDGDIIFVTSTNEERFGKKEDKLLDTVSILAAKAAADATINAVKSAETLKGIPGLKR